MKKVSSAAMLALQLTWKAALLVFLLTAGVQTFSVYRWLMPGGVPLQATFGFETLLQSAVQSHGMWFAAILMFGLIVSAIASKGSKSLYTIRRLGLSELQTTLVFGLVFTGYYLLYWAFQLGLVFTYFAWFSRFSLVSSNALMLAAWRSEWFHFLLPLGEWLGYIRNAVICLSFGFCAAFGVQRSRMGKFPWACGVPVILCGVIGPQRPASSTDLVLILLLLGCTIAYCFFTREGGLDHEAL